MTRIMLGAFLGIAGSVTEDWYMRGLGYVSNVTGKSVVIAWCIAALFAAILMTIEVRDEKIK